MATRSARFCKYPGCNNIIVGAISYCNVHIADAEAAAARQKQAKQRRGDMRRGNSRERGYTSTWSKYSKAFLARPENQFCKLHLDSGCAVVAQCVDHIEPPKNAHDPLFWDKTNHQAACIHCNSVKGHRKLVGTFVFGAFKPGDF